MSEKKRSQQINVASWVVHSLLLLTGAIVVYLALHVDKPRGSRSELKVTPVVFGNPDLEKEMCLNGQRLIIEPSTIGPHGNAFPGKTRCVAMQETSL